MAMWVACAGDQENPWRCSGLTVAIMQLLFVLLLVAVVAVAEAAAAVALPLLMLSITQIVIILRARAPTTDSGILGIYTGPNMITIISCGHY